MKQFKFVSQSESSTRLLGIEIGRHLPASFVLGLNGTLGSGKTRLTQAIAIGLQIPEGEVVSPTYTLCTPHHGRLVLIHLDAYRIKSDEEVDELGLDEVVEDGAVLVVEWADRIADLAPDFDVLCNILPLADHGRQFEFIGISAAGQRLLQQVDVAMAGNSES